MHKHNIYKIYFWGNPPPPTHPLSLQHVKLQQSCSFSVDIENTLTKLIMEGHTPEALSSGLSVPLYCISRKLNGQLLVLLTARVKMFPSPEKRSDQILS
jgi:hypothetical protein